MAVAAEAAMRNVLSCILMGEMERWRLVAMGECQVMATC